MDRTKPYFSTKTRSLKHRRARIHTPSTPPLEPRRRHRDTAAVNRLRQITRDVLVPDKARKKNAKKAIPFLEKGEQDPLDAKAKKRRSLVPRNAERPVTTIPEHILERATEMLRAAAASPGRSVVVHLTDPRHSDAAPALSCRALVDASWTKVRHKGPEQYVVTPDGVLFYREEGGGTPVCYPGIRYTPLRDAIRWAVVAEAPGIRIDQESVKWEMAGLITSDLNFGNITAAVCKQEQGAAFSSDPFCAAMRLCKMDEVTPGRLILGEFHSHPEASANPRVNFYPPSANDLYQLAISALDGVHNLSVVVAPEGLYFCRMCQSSYVQLYRDLESRGLLKKKRKKTTKCKQKMGKTLSTTYYEQQTVGPDWREFSLSRCRQPTEKKILRDGSTPYLAALFDEPRLIYENLIHSAILTSKADRIAAFVKRIYAAIGLDIEFVSDRKERQKYPDGVFRSSNRV